MIVTQFDSATVEPLFLMLPNAPTRTQASRGHRHFWLIKFPLYKPISFFSLEETEFADGVDANRRHPVEPSFPIKVDWGQCPYGSIKFISTAPLKSHALPCSNTTPIQARRGECPRNSKSTSILCGCSIWKIPKLPETRHAKNTTTKMYNFFLVRNPHGIAFIAKQPSPKPLSPLCRFYIWRVSTFPHPFLPILLSSWNNTRRHEVYATSFASFASFASSLFHHFIFFFRPIMSGLYHVYGRVKISLPSFHPIL